MSITLDSPEQAPAAARPARTRGPRPSRATQPKITRIDAAAIAAEAAAEVTAELERTEDLFARVAAARQVIDHAEAQLDRLRARRDAMAVSLHLYDNVRAVNTMCGLGRTQMSKITREAVGGHEAPVVPGSDATIDRAAYAALAERFRVRRYDKDKALRDLPVVSAEVVRLNARAAAARKVRDDAAVALLKAKKITKTEAADLMGRVRSLVSHRLVGRAGV